MTDLRCKEIIDNYFNGNISDFKKQVKILSKREFLELILVMQEDYQEEVIKLLNIL
mgnify:CR=1 FL=1